MNRLLVCILFGLLFVLFLLSVVTEPLRDADFSTKQIIVHFAAALLTYIGLVAYCGFAACHAVQRIADPRDRVGWILVIIPFTIFGSLIYLLTKYQHFREIGKGSLIIDCKKKPFSAFFQLSEQEKKNV